jgi:predicted ATP-grasp superfamily ATP-dependent carboligase
MAAFGYKGCSHVEFKLDPRDRSYRLMEINARTGISSQQGITAGVDLPWIGYQYLTVDHFEHVKSTGFVRGVTYVNDSFDVYAFLAMWKTGDISFLRWLRSFLNARAKAIWAWDDPGPFLRTAWALAKAGLRKVFQSFHTSMDEGERHGNAAPTFRLEKKEHHHV